MTGDGALTFRAAGPADWEAVAGLQIASWRSAYRGMLRDDYLDAGIHAERRTLWRSRFTGEPGPDQVVAVAEDGTGLVALACILAGHDPIWGSLIDNLHVRPDRKRTGIGRLVLADAAARIPAVHAGTPLHLTVLDANLPARAAYEAWGGEFCEYLDAELPDGQSLPVRRYRWADPDALIRSLLRR
ncbi:GNAT family N-acetyltransferase [Enterovirga aerilata]|uniref:GNAT family N-acetyltransferase n=1 Tax=Enterovirga aerilata TaxID=2730920 RepID=A0A849ID84_9HYPH|nr:GNAT family N-acetyltransferase [Enterovirga sp. DB1703]NNM74379.1 GNAT family N-acetyltransferase [Enterovirga sp. DB1703]